MILDLSSVGNKVLLGLLALITICFVSFVIYKEQQISKMQSQLETAGVAMQQLQDNITRSQSQFATKTDIEALANANNVNLATIQQNIDALNATLSSINVVSVSSSGQSANNVSSTSTTPVVSTAPPTTTPTSICMSDPFGYQSNTQNLLLTEQFSAGVGTIGNTSAPIGQVSFNASQKAPWTIDIAPRQYNIVNVMATDPDGSHSVYNKFSIVENGKTYPVNISNAQYREIYPTASMSWWNPHLFMAIDAGVNTTAVRGEISPGLSVGLMSYGKTKSNPDLSILQIGLGYGTVSHTPILDIKPININIGNMLSSTFIDNTYAGPSLGIGMNGNLIFGAGITVGF